MSYTCHTQDIPNRIVPKIKFSLYCWNYQQRRNCRWWNGICNTRSESNRPKWWSTYLNEMWLKTDSQISEIKLCEINCFAVVDKWVFKEKMKIIIKAPRQTRKQFLVSSSTTGSGYLFNGYPVWNQLLHDAFKFSRGMLSSVRNKESRKIAASPSKLSNEQFHSTVSTRQKSLKPQQFNHNLLILLQRSLISTYHHSPFVSLDVFTDHLTPVTEIENRRTTQQQTPRLLFLSHSRRLTKRNWGRREMSPVRPRQAFRNIFFPIASSHSWSTLLWKWQKICPTAVRFTCRIRKKSRFINYTDKTSPISTQKENRQLSHTFCPFGNRTASIWRSGRSPDFRSDLSSRESMGKYRLKLKKESKRPRYWHRKMPPSNLLGEREACVP